MYSLDYASIYQSDHPGHRLNKKIWALRITDRSPCSTFFNSFFPPLLAVWAEQSLWSTFFFCSIEKVCNGEDLKQGWTRDRLFDSNPNLVNSAVVEAHWTEGGQLCFHALLVMLQLFPLDLLPHFPSLLDGLHHCVLVPEQRGRI